MGMLLDIAVTRPLGIILMYMYELIGSYGLSIIIFTILFKLCFFPMSLKTKRSTSKTASLQPQIKALQKKYKNEKEKLSLEISNLYKKEGVSMTGGCLPMLLTFPIMIALYYVVQRPLTFMMGLSIEQISDVAARLGVEVTSNIHTLEIHLANLIYSNFEKVSDISPLIVPIDFDFMGINLAANPDLKHLSILWFIPIISGLSAFFASYASQKFAPNTDMQNNPSMKMMLYTMPFMSVWFGFILPASVGIYWILGNVMMIVQEVFLNWYIQKTDKLSDPAQGGKNHHTKEENKKTHD